MSEFVFLYRGGTSARNPERAQERMQRWMAWFKALSDKGHLKDHGKPLELIGKVVQGSRMVVTDGPFAETKDVVGGFSLIEARDLDQAVELTRGCPIFDADGAVEVRPAVPI